VQIELAKGDEVVAEPERGRPLVLKRNPNGDVRTEVLADQLEAPQGVVLLLGQNVSVFVAEAAAGRITRITPAEGGMKKETVRSELNAPMGLAIDSCSGDLLVTTVGDGRLLRLSRDGSRLQVLAEGLKGPMGVTVSQDGAIVVAESLAGRLIRISPDGSDRVSLVQGLLKPEMIAWGRNGMIYVAESEGGPNQ
jgi:glucose/arabinose dehydrogenase